MFHPNWCRSLWINNTMQSQILLGKNISVITCSYCCGRWSAQDRKILHIYIASSLSNSCTVDMATRFQSSMSLHPAIDQTSHSFEGRFGPTAPRTCSRKTVCSWYVPVCFFRMKAFLFDENTLVSCYMVYLWYGIPRTYVYFIPNCKPGKNDPHRAAGAPPVHSAWLLHVGDACKMWIVWCTGKWPDEILITNSSPWFIWYYTTVHDWWWFDASKYWHYHWTPATHLVNFQKHLNPYKYIMRNYMTKP